MWLNWRFLLCDKCAQIIQYPTKTNLSVKKELQASQTRRAAEDHWQPFKSREKGSWASQLLAGWLVTCGWHICIFKDAHRQTQYVWECLGGMWKTPVLPLKRFPPPLKDGTTFWGPLSVKQLLRQRVVNKLLGLDAQKTVAVRRAALSALHQTEKDAAGNYKSGAITQQQIWQEQCCTLFELQDSFTQCLFQWAWTMQAECALCCRAGDCSSELGVNYKRGLCKLDMMAS